MNDGVYLSLSGRSADHYRRAGLAATAAYLDLDPPFVQAALDDAIDEHLTAIRWDREQLRESRHADYVSLLTRECIVHLAAAAAERLGDDPEALAEEAGSDGFVHARVAELVQWLEVGDAGESADRRMLEIRKSLAGYYRQVAVDLVCGSLLSPILTVAEELQRGVSLSAARVVKIVIASQL